MAKEYISLKNLKYLLKEVHDVSQLTQYHSFQDYDWEACEMMLDAARQLADTHLFPHFTAMDREEPELENGVLRVHPEVTAVVEAMAEGGWIGAGAPQEWGGMELPRMIGVAAAGIFHAANNGVIGFTGLTSGAAHLILSFGSEEMKHTYVPNMFGGKWQGTMALTEPQAGSSLSDVKTSATPLGEGVFRIKGQKIFICRAQIPRGCSGKYGSE
jgi:alkylation response protein AidB-like acyl-CoA dehydrogenase